MLLNSVDFQDGKYTEPPVRGHSGIWEGVLNMGAEQPLVPTEELGEAGVCLNVGVSGGAMG